jgi:hypothetical protein
MFIKQLDIVSNPDMIIDNLNKILEENIDVWRTMNQLSLKRRIDAEHIWEDGTGSLYDRTTREKVGIEQHFNTWNIDHTWYVRQQVELLQNTLGIEIGRVRFMRLLPHCGLSIHNDSELRYHLVLKTNSKAYISQYHIENDADSDVPTMGKSYHIPLNNHWYKVDTRRVHWVYNGGKEERIHLVVCGV